MPKGFYDRPTDEERFWTRVNKDGPVHPVLGTACWLWTGAVLKCKSHNAVHHLHPVESD